MDTEVAEHIATVCSVLWMTKIQIDSKVIAQSKGKNNPNTTTDCKTP